MGLNLCQLTGRSAAGRPEYLKATACQGCQAGFIKFSVHLYYLTTFFLSLLHVNKDTIFSPKYIINYLYYYFNYLDNKDVNLAAQGAGDRAEYSSFCH